MGEASNPLSNPARQPRVPDAPFEATFEDGVWYIDFETDVVFRYKGSRSDLMAQDHVTAVGGDAVSISGGAFHFNPYDPVFIEEKFRGRVSDTVLQELIDMALERARAERKQQRDEKRRRFYWEAAERRKHGQKTGCKCKHD